MYAEIADLRARLGAGVFGEIYPSGDAAQEDLADAQAEVDGCLAKRYSIPVTAVQSLPLLKGWTLTLCEERAYSRAAGSSYAEKVAVRAAQVRKYLADAASGAFSLPGAAENASGASGISMIAGDEPLFTRQNLKGY